jgi:serine protease AprX
MGVTWPRFAGAALAVSVGMVGLSPALASASTAAAAGARVGVVVRATPGEEPAVEQVVVGLGGKVGRRIGILNGFSATINQGSMARLSAAPGVASVTADAKLQLLGTSYDANADRNSMYRIENQIGSRTMWGSTTGAGVDVALIDSGVTPVQGLNNPGQVFNGPDLTEESPNPATATLDTFGHGTFMAGIIAGHDPGVNPATNKSNTTDYLGVAPGARIVSVKVADGRGRTDVSQVIAGIDWVVEHAHDPGMNIRVLNLSFGTDSSQTYQLDPLAFATEVAWQAGIVVVVSAGNAGTSQGRLTMPAADPFVIAVGASDMNGHSSSYNAIVPAFSSRGDGVRNPDLVAPGVHVQGLRVPGSYIDTMFGATGRINDRFFRGSGTSQSAAVVSGSVAELVQRFPNLTPDQVKGMFVGTAVKLRAGAIEAQGAGMININRAKTAAPPTAIQQFTPSTGDGSIDASRGSFRLPGMPTGEQDIFGQPFNSAAVAAAEAAGNTWSGNTWSGNTWSGNTWSGNTWSGNTWSGNTWSGNTWSGNTWSDSDWSGGGWV